MHHYQHCTVVSATVFSQILNIITDIKTGDSSKKNATPITKNCCKFLLQDTPDSVYKVNALNHRICFNPRIHFEMYYHSGRRFIEGKVKPIFAGHVQTLITGHS